MKTTHIQLNGITIPRHEYSMERMTVFGEQQYRIALGELMEPEKRKIFHINELTYERGNKTGTIGYLDYIFRTWSIPKNLSRALSIYDYFEKKSLAILTIGIEPEYQHKGYATHLIERAEEIAVANHVEAIIISDITKEHDFIKKILKKREGYSYFHYDSDAVKFLDGTVVCSDANKKHKPFSLRNIISRYKILTHS